MSVNPIYVDTTVRLVAEFRGFNGISVDPTTIVVQHQDPDGVLTSSTYSVANTDWTHPLTGTFGFDVVVATAGTWQYSFEGTGACDTYGEATFIVSEKAF